MGCGKLFPVFLVSIFLLGFFSFFPSSLLRRAAGESGLVGILISQEIRPFIQMSEGLEAHLGTQACRIFLDQDGRPYSADPRIKELEPERFAVMVAVGPHALSYLITHDWPPSLVYGMVLNPDRIVGNRVAPCGVSLNISPFQQISIIRQTLPGITRLGVLFDPANNQKWFDSAKGIAGPQGIHLIPLVVSQRSDVASFFRDGAPEVDAVLFIPDRTVISKAIIQYVIKQGILHGIPTIGYNIFFHEAGAALSFTIDYKDVGKRVAEQVRAIMDGRPCVAVGPPYKVRLNANVVRALGIKVNRPLPAVVEEGP